MSMRILVYDDSPVFGGHEVMTLLALDAMARRTDWQFHCLAAPVNARLMARLQELQSTFAAITVAPLPHAFHRLQGILNHVQHRRIAALARRFLAAAPDLALIIQGDMEISSTGLLAARKAGVPAVSYIPLPHNQVEKGGALGFLRDPFARHLYRVPDGFITISTVLADMLRAKGATAPISVVYNGIATDHFQPVNPDDARKTLGLPGNPPIVGIAGRLERKQKRQHLLIDAIADNAPPVAGCHAAFCGDGPDRGFFSDRAASLGVSGRTHFLAWRSDLATFHSALDALAIPSRYEGVPLVMLEALCCGTPVIAANRDGMREMLPPEWLFEPGNPAAFRERIAHVLGNRDAARGHAAALQQRIRDSMTERTFGEAFTGAVEGFLETLRK